MPLHDTDTDTDTAAATETMSMATVYAYVLDRSSHHRHYPEPHAPLSSQCDDFPGPAAGPSPSPVLLRYEGRMATRDSILQHMLRQLNATALAAEELSLQTKAWSTLWRCLERKNRAVSAKFSEFYARFQHHDQEIGRVLESRDRTIRRVGSCMIFD